MRDEFSTLLVELAKVDPKIILLTGDHGYSLFDRFRDACPKQYINAGIAEQNMVGMAAGLSRSGFHPIVYGLAAFIPLRVLEQIKLDVAHDNLPVIFIGDGAGLVYSHLGNSHQAIEDIACTRGIPNLSVYSPADAFELNACMRVAYKSRGPSYIRIGKSDISKVHNCPISIPSGEIIEVKKGKKSLIILATGSMVATAMSISDSTLNASVWSVPVIKPLNFDYLAKCLAEVKFVITIEEHNIYGGMGSAIAECLSERLPVKILRIGINDRFSELCGSYEYLLTEHELDKYSIKNKILNFINKNGVL